MSTPNPKMIAANLKPKVARPPLNKREPKQVFKPKPQRQWIRKDSYFLEIRDVFCHKVGGPLFVVLAADESPISAEKVIHCRPTLNEKAKTSIFYTGNADKKKFVYVYEVPESDR